MVEQGLKNGSLWPDRLHKQENQKHFTILNHVLTWKPAVKKENAKVCFESISEFYGSKLKDKGIQLS